MKFNKSHLRNILRRYFDLLKDARKTLKLRNANSEMIS